MHLLDEVAVLHHAGEFREPPQRHLAPLAAHLGAAQRGDEVARLALQRLLPERHAFERSAQRPERFRALLLDARDLLVRAGERLAHRGQQRGHGLLAIREVARGQLLLLPERLPGELQEHLAVAAQGRSGDGVEPDPQALARVEFGPRLRQLDLERVRAPAADQPARRERDQRQQREQQQQDRGIVHAEARVPGAVSAAIQSSSSCGVATMPCGCQLAGSSCCER